MKKRNIKNYYLIIGLILLAVFLIFILTLVKTENSYDSNTKRTQKEISSLTKENIEINLTILNPIEHLKDRSIWTVRFTTVGEGNLSIWSSNASFEEIQNDLDRTIDEMEFLNISCGSESLSDRLIVFDKNNVSYKYSDVSELDSIRPNKFLIEDYYCEEVGTFNNYMNIGGYAVLEFEFVNEDVVIRQQAIDPVVSSYSLNSSSLTNTTSEDLNVYYTNSSDTTSTSTDWRLNGTSIAVLNLPFNVNVSSTGVGDVRDYSNYYNNATIDSATWVSDGKYGGAYYFDGTNDNISAPVPSLFSDISNNDFSISVWANISTIASGDRMIDIYYDANNWFQFNFPSAGVVQAYVDDSTTYYFASNSSLNTDQWYHFLAVWDASETSLTFYIDGEYHAGSGTGGASAGGVQLATLGMRGDGANDYEGVLDEFMIFDRALTKGQVHSIYQAGYNNRSLETINNSETSIGENWSVALTPNNETHIGNTNLSYNLTIINGTAGSNIPQITWENPTPDDGQTLNQNFTYLNTTITYPSNSGNTSAWFDWNQTLLGYWSMDYYNSSHILDNSTHGGLGDFVGTGFGTDNITTGARGNSLLFDGTTGSYVDAWISDEANYSIHNDNITVSFWFKINDLSQSDQTFFHFNIDANNRQYIRRYTSSGDIRVWQFIDSNSNGGDTTGNHITDTNWHHLVWKIEGTNNSIYIDGVYKESITLTYSLNSIIGTPDIRLGTYDATTFPLDGNLDEVMYFGRSLSDQEILALYNNSANRLYNNFTSLGYGEYNYSAYAIDDSGNYNVTDEREITLSEGGGGTPITSCQTISSHGNYVLTQNVTSSTTCFTINAVNVTLDCDGYWINYSTGGVSGYGVYTTQDNTTIENCYIYDGTRSGGGADRYGIFLGGSDNSILFNNFINTSNGRAIRAPSSLLNLNITRNTAWSDSANGMYISSENSYIGYNDFTSISAFGLDIGLGSKHNTFVGNNGTSNTNAGIFVYNSFNNTFIDNVGTSNTDRGFEMDNSDNNTIIGLTAKGLSGGSAIGIFLDESEDNLFKDCVNVTGSQYDVSVWGPAGSTNNTFLNCSYDLGDENVVNGGNSNYLIRQWYYQAYVNDTAGDSIQNANISFYNSTGDLAFTALTNSSGWIQIQNLTEYINLDGTRTYQNNFSILVNHSGYNNQTEQYNLTIQQNNVNDFFTLTGIVDTTYLTIIDPTTGDPEKVADADNITVRFNFTYEGTNQTSGVTIGNVFVAGEEATIRVSGGGSGTFYAINFTGFEADSTSPYDGWIDGGASVTRASGLADYCSDTACPDTGSYSISITDDDSTAELNQTFDFATGCGGGQCTYVILSGYLYPNSYETNEGFSLVCDYGDASEQVIDTWTESGGDTVCGYGMSDNTTWEFFSCNLSAVGCTLDSSTKISIIGGQLTAPDETTGDRVYVDGLNVTGYASGTTTEFAYYNASWNVNVTVPSGFTGLQDLFVNATYSGSTESDNETDAIDYGTGNYISSCQTIDESGTYEVIGNLTSTGTCMNITANDVIFDCSDYWINYSTSGGDNEIGVYTNATNVTLKNCNIYEGSQGSGGTDSYGIYYNTADNGTIFNNYLSTNESSIRIEDGANYNNLTSNTAFNLINPTIVVHTSSSYNYLQDNTAESDEDAGFFIRTNSNYNTLIENNGTGGNTGSGLYSNESDHNTYKNNDFTSFASNDYGIYLYNSSNNTFINNTAREDNRFGTNIYLSDNNIFINHTSLSGVYGIYIRDAENNTFMDCVNISSGTAGDEYDIFYYDTSGNNNNTFINCSYDTDLVQGTGAELIRRWWIDGNVSDVSRSPLENANMSLHNSTIEYINTQLTDANGNINRYAVTEYINASGTKTYFGNYTINTTLTDYVTNSTSYNLTIEKNIFNEVIMVIEDSCSYSGSGNWAINCSDNCTISSSVVGDGSNISIIGNGHTFILDNITGFQNIRIDGLTGHCRVTCMGGCFQT